MLAKRDVAEKGGMSKAQAKAIVPAPARVYELPWSVSGADDVVSGDAIHGVNRWFASLPTSTQPNGQWPCAASRASRTRSSPIPGRFDRARLARQGGVGGASTTTATFSPSPQCLASRVGRTSGRRTLLRDFVNDTMRRFRRSCRRASYASAPHIGSDRPTTIIRVRWLRESFPAYVYDAVTAIERWARTAMILYYDEHGGFYDHVESASVPYTVRDQWQP